MDVVINGIIAEIPAKVKSLPSQGSYYLNLLACLGFPPDSPPLADLLRLSHGLEGQWLIASPVHWQATHNDAMLVATDETLELSENESLSLFTDVAQFLQTEGLELIYHDAQTWLVKVNNKAALHSQPAVRMLHQSMMPAFDVMDNSLFWQRLITELQMYLCSHSLNEKRQHSLAINGLWFWGGGEFKLTTHRTLITNDDTLLRVPAGVFKEITRFDEMRCNYQKNDLLSIQQAEPFNLQSLEKKTQQQSVSWYWNNQAYRRPATSWWSRLWRK